MSYVADVARIMQLTCRKSTLDHKISLLSQRLVQYQTAAMRLVSGNITTDPTKPDVANIFQQQGELAIIGKKSEMELELSKAERQAVVTEIESVQKMVQEDVKTFKTFANT